MATILITGASGLIGRNMVKVLSPKHNVICLSRKKIDIECQFVQGTFYSYKDLCKLDRYKIDVLIHLGAVTGGCSEEDGLAVNVDGTRTLLRYLLDNNCRKFVMASSIATVGLAVKEFMPIELPMPDEHPCLAHDAYGLSKYLMEEITRYFSRIYSDADFIDIRLGAVSGDDEPPSLIETGPVYDWAFVYLGRIFLSDAVEAFTLAAEAPHNPGLRIMNAVGPDSASTDTVPDLMRSWFPHAYKDLDLSHYQRPGHEKDPVFAINRIKEELSFEPKVSVFDFPEIY